MKEQETNKIIKTEVKLTASDLLYRRLFETAQDGILILDADTGVIEDVNPFLITILGYTYTELLGKQLWEIGFFKDIIANQAFFVKLQKERFVRYEKMLLQKKEGLPIWVEFVSNIYDMNRKQVIYCNVRDITERKNAEEELAEKEYFLRESQSAGNIGSYKTNFVTGLWQSSETLDRIFGIDKNYNRNVAGWLDIVHPGDKQKMDEYLRLEVLGKRKSFNKEYRIKRINDKQTKWVCGMGDLKFDDRGNVTELIGTIQDISERKNAEELLFQSQQDYKNLLENMNDGFMVDDISGKVIFVNKKFLEIFGLEKGDVNDFVIEDFVAPDYAELLRDRHNHRIAGEKVPDVFVFEGLRKNGNKIWLEVRVNQIIKEGMITGTQSVISDITERKKAEDALRESENHLHTIVQAEPECVKLLNINNELQEMNPAGLAMIEADNLQQVKGKSILGIIDDPYRNAFNELNQNVFKGKPGKMEFEITGLKGTHHWMETHAVPLKDAGGKITSLLAVTRDITERKKAEDSLRESEETFRRLFRESADSILLLDDTGFIDCNLSAVSILGYSSSQEVLHKKPWDISPEKQPDGRLSTEKAEAMIAIALQQGYNRFEWVHTKSDGTEFPVEVMLTPIILKGKQLLYAVLRDITERKKAEQQKEFDSNNHKALLNNTNDLMWSVGRDFKLITCNESFEKMVKLVSGKTIAKGSDILASGFNEEQLKRFRKYYERAFSGESFTEIEYMDIPDDFWSEISFNPIYNEDAIAGTACFSRDITESKKAEEKLKENNERYEFVNKATQDTIWEWDYHTNKGKWGEGIITTFGYSEDKLNYGESWLDEYVHPDDKERILKNIQDRIENRLQNYQNEYRFRCADGSYKYVFDRGYILYDENKKPYRMIGAMTDLTEKKRLESELAEQQIKQQKLITEITIQAQEKERNELGRELHDNINQILATIKMYLGMVRSGQGIREELIGKSHEYVNEVMEEIRKLSHSLVAPSLGDIGLKEALEELTKDTNFHNNLQIKLVVDENYNENGLDKNKKLMFYRIVQEQLGNVVKYSGATKVVVTFRTDNGRFFLSVADNGVGFDTSQKGPGIGLKNISSRIEFYSGNMDLITSPGNGCILEVNIPY